MSDLCRHGNASVACWNPQCRAAGVAAAARERSQDRFRTARRSTMATIEPVPANPKPWQRSVHFGMRPAVPDVAGASVGDCHFCGDPIPPSERAPIELGGPAHQYCSVKSKSDAAIRLQRVARPRRFA